MIICSKAAVAKYLQRLVLKLQMEREKEIMDLEPFPYTYFDKIFSITFVHTLYLSANESSLIVSCVSNLNMMHEEQLHPEGGWYSLEQYIGFEGTQAFNYYCSLHQV